jgi:hypothetical protein
MSAAFGSPPAFRWSLNDLRDLQASALPAAFCGGLDPPGRQDRREAPSGSVTLGGHAQGHPRSVPHLSFPPHITFLLGYKRDAAMGRNKRRHPNARSDILSGGVQK